MQQNCKFYGFPFEDPYQFLTEFLQICETVKTNRADPEVYRLMLFPFAVRDKARTWLDSHLKIAWILGISWSRPSWINSFLLKS